MKRILQSLLVMMALVVPLSVSAVSYDNSQNVQPNADGVTYNLCNITPAYSAGTTYNLLGAGGTGNTLSLVFNSETCGNVVVTPSTSKPASAPSVAPGTVVIYYDVTFSGGFSSSGVTSSTWIFAIANSTLTANGLSASSIHLAHYNGSAWVNLTTTVVSTTSTTTTFSATVTGFSPFAVAGTSGSVLGDMTTSLVAAGSSAIFYVFILLAVLISLGTAYFINRSKAKKA